MRLFNVVERTETILRRVEILDNQFDSAGFCLDDRVVTIFVLLNGTNEVPGLAECPLQALFQYIRNLTTEVLEPTIRPFFSIRQCLPLLFIIESEEQCVVVVSHR